MKICTKCKIEKDESCFSKRSEIRSGLQSHCKECRAIPAKIYRQKNIERKRQTLKQWRIQNPEKIAGYYSSRREEHLKQAAEWRKKNPLKRKQVVANSARKNRAKINQRRCFRYHNDPTFRTKQCLKAACRRIFKGVAKPARALELLGMDLKEFKVYIQGQFRPGMTWENQGLTWHLDHVRPLASFDLLDHEQQKLACYWENFQPLFAEENLKKGATWQN